LTELREVVDSESAAIHDIWFDYNQTISAHCKPQWCDHLFLRAKEKPKLKPKPISKPEKEFLRTMMTGVASAAVAIIVDEYVLKPIERKQWYALPGVKCPRHQIIHEGPCYMCEAEKKSGEPYPGYYFAPKI
jgi:hypothetical protein